MDKCKIKTSVFVVSFIVVVIIICWHEAVLDWRNDSDAELKRQKLIFVSKAKTRPNKNQLAIDEFINLMTQTNYDYEDSTIDHNIESMTSLFCLGPAKTGTSTFVTRFSEFKDIQWWGQEFPYWKTCKAPIHLWNSDQWQQFIDNWFISANQSHTHNRIRNTSKFQLNDLSTYLTFSNIYKQNVTQLNQTKNTINKIFDKDKFECSLVECNVCDIQFYQHHHWDRLHIEKKHMHQEITDKTRQDEDEDEDKDKDKKNWLVDKEPGNLHSILISIVFSNYYPKLKVFAIARHPIDELMSIAWHYKQSIMSNFETRQLQQRQSMEQIVYSLIQQYWEKFEFLSMQHECQSFVKLFKLDHDDENINFDKNSNQFFEKFMYKIRYMVKQMLHYKQIIMAQIENEEEKLISIVLNNPLILHAVIFWMYVYDEKFGYDNWNQFRIIQHEWMISDLSISLGVIKCWLQTNQQIVVTNTHDKYIMFKKCPQIYFYDEDYYYRIATKLERESHVKMAHQTQSTRYFQARKKLTHFYKPCTDGLIQLLQYRNELLLGSWVPYKY